MSEPHVAPIRTPLPARLLRLAGLGLWLLAAVAATWELLARQPPASPLHLGVLAGPIAQLCGFAFALGTGAWVASLAWPSLYPKGDGLFAALSLVLGALVHVAALTYAASVGILAVQLLDPRPDARFTLYVRALGHLLTVLGLLGLLRRAVR